MSRGTKWKKADVESKSSTTSAAKVKSVRSETANKIITSLVWVGIDPGTNTGLAVKIDGVFSQIRTVTICEAIEEVKQLHVEFGDRLKLRIEDARLRTFFGNAGREKLMGAGSIKRDCTIWEDEMNRLAIPFQMVHPKDVKATTSDYFKKITGWVGRTSIHAREAAWLIL
jgi:hypothetical protein